jgi:Tol biopolymer transport system component
MKTRIPFTLLLTLIAALFVVSAGPQAQSADEVLLKQAVDLEKAKGDVKGAIEIWKKLAQSTNPKIVAMAREELARLQQPSSLSTPARPDRFPSEIVTRQAASDGLTLRRTLANGDEVAVRQSGSDQRRQVSLVLVDTRAGKERELTRLSALPRAFDMEPSPDGAYVAVIVGVRADTAGSGAAYREELVIVNTRGAASPTILPLGVGDSPSQTNVYRPLLQWSPDSQWLPFVAPGATGLVEFKLLRAGTREPRSLGLQGDGPPDFRWSPSEAELALHVTRSSTQTDEIAVVTIGTGAVHRIPTPSVPTSNGARTRLGAWTKGGLWVLASPTAVLASDYWLVNVPDKRARKVCSGGPISLVSPRNDNSFRGGTWDDCLSVSQDGSSQLVWLRQSKRLVVRETATGRDRNLTQGSGEEHAGYMSPDDRVAVFASNRDGFWGLYGVLIDQAPTANPVLLLRMDGQPSGLSVEWRDDGMRADISYYETNIFRVGIDKVTGRSTGMLERLTQDVPSNRAPSFSGDGRRIAYWSNGTRFGLTIMDSQGSNERQMTEQQFIRWHAAPMWSSDSELLVEAYHAERPTPFSYQIVDARTGVARDATVPRAVFPEALDYVGASGLSVIPARQELAYIDRTGSSGQVIRARSLKDGTERVLATFDDGGVHAFAISATGEQVAYSRFMKDGQCPCELGVVNTETAQRRVLETPPNPQVPAAWSPDGRYLLYGAARPRIMDTVAGKSWTLMDPAQQPAWLQEGSWSPEGTAIALTVSSNRNEIRRWKELTPVTIARAIQSGSDR